MSFNEQKINKQKTRIRSRTSEIQTCNNHILVKIFRNIKFELFGQKFVFIDKI